MFLNVTNHPSSEWSLEQREAAEKYGEIRDFPFPDVPVCWDSREVRKQAAVLAEEIAALAPAAVLCQGEMSMTYHLVRRLSEKGILVLCACSARKTKEENLPDGSVRRVSVFAFQGFRAYE